MAPSRLALTGEGQGSSQARLQALNDASVESLQWKPFEITKAKAKSIVEHRNKLPGGKFESWAQVEHMTKLRIGVGEITVTKLKKKDSALVPPSPSETDGSAKIDSHTGVPPVKSHESSLRSD